MASCTLARERSSPVSNNCALSTDMRKQRHTRPGGLLPDHRYRNIRRNACPSHVSPVTFYLSTVIEKSDGMLVRGTCPRFKLSRELMTHLGGRGALLLRCPTGFWRLQEALATLVAANGVLLRFQTAQRFLAAPLVAEAPLLTFPGTSWRHRELRRWVISGETIADCGFRLPKGLRGGGPR